eukprot:738408_1
MSNISDETDVIIAEGRLWEQKFNPNRPENYRVFYLNCKSKEARSKKPEELKAYEQHLINNFTSIIETEHNGVKPYANNSISSDESPGGWRKIPEPDSNRILYYNSKTEERQWSTIVSPLGVSKQDFPIPSRPMTLSALNHYDDSSPSMVPFSRPNTFSLCDQVLSSGNIAKPEQIMQPKYGADPKYFVPPSEPAPGSPALAKPEPRNPHSRHASPSLSHQLNSVSAPEEKSLSADGVLKPRRKRRSQQQMRAQWARGDRKTLWECPRCLKVIHKNMRPKHPCEARMLNAENADSTTTLAGEIPSNYSSNISVLQAIPISDPSQATDQKPCFLQVNQPVPTNSSSSNAGRRASQSSAEPSAAYVQQAFLAQNGGGGGGAGLSAPPNPYMYYQQHAMQTFPSENMMRMAAAQGHNMPFPFSPMQFYQQAQAAAMQYMSPFYPRYNFQSDLPALTFNQPGSPGGTNEQAAASSVPLQLQYPASSHTVCITEIQLADEQSPANGQSVDSPPIKVRAGRGKMCNRRHVLRNGPLVVYSEGNGIVRGMRNLDGVETCQLKDTAPQYFRNALLFLGYTDPTDLNTIPPVNRLTLAADLGVAALVREE